METQTPKKHLSWSDIDRLSTELSAKIKASKFKPDYLIGITVGGLIPLALLAKKLDINSILTISASSYEKEKQGELNIIYLPEINLEGKKILLIDEIAETGTTLKNISGILIDKYKIDELKTATISVNRSSCNFVPDFSVLDENSWVVFPWE